MPRLRELLLPTLAGSGLLALGLGLPSGCGGGSNGASDGGSFFYDAGFGGGDSARSDANSGSTDAGLPPETEERRTFGDPQAGARYVYVANPRRNSVAVIDSTSLSIQSVEAGAEPRYLRTLPGRDEAVVLNVGSDDATVLRTGDDGSTATSSVPVVSDANALAVSPDGAHAVVFFDTNDPTAPPTTGSGSFQDVTVLTLASGADRGVDLSVGFRPLDVVFSRDSSAAFVITEDGVSVLRFAALTGPAIVPTVALGDSSTTRDVSVTPDGHYAIAREQGATGLLLADLVSGSVTHLEVGAEVTDLDVAPSGAEALAVVREQSAVLRIPIPNGFSDPSTIRTVQLPGELVGSVSIAPGGKRAVLFTTAANVERAVILDLTADPDPPRGVRLRKSVRAVVISPDGRTALVVHTKIPGDPNDASADLETRIDRSYGYSLIDLSSGFAKLQLTDAEVGPLAVSPDGAYAFVTVRDDARNVRQVHRVSMRSFAVDEIDLGSPPLSVGVVPNTRRAFIGQDHPEGRITFVDWETGSLQSVTGYELNSRVVQ